MSSPFATTAEAAEFLRLANARGFRKFARRHAIPVKRIGRKVVVRRQDLEDFVEGRLRLVDVVARARVERPTTLRKAG